MSVGVEIFILDWTKIISIHFFIDCLPKIVVIVYFSLQIMNRIMDIVGNNI